MAKKLSIKKKATRKKVQLQSPADRAEEIRQEIENLQEELDELEVDDEDEEDEEEYEEREYQVTVTLQETFYLDPAQVESLEEEYAGDVESFLHEKDLIDYSYMEELDFNWEEI